MLSDTLMRAPKDAVEWQIRVGLTPYPEAVEFMEERAAAIAAGWSKCTRHPTQHPALVIVIAHPDHRE